MRPMPSTANSSSKPECDLVVRKVAATEQPPKVEREEVTILTRRERRGGAAKGRPMYAPAIAALFTRIRRSEVLVLRQRHVDLDATVIAVRETVEETKAGLRFKPTKARPAAATSPARHWCRHLAEHRRQQLERRPALGLGGKLADDAPLFPGLDGSPQSLRAFPRHGRMPQRLLARQRASTGSGIPMPAI